MFLCWIGSTANSTCNTERNKKLLELDSSIEGSQSNPHVPNIAGENKAKMKGKKLLHKLATATPVESQFCELIEFDILNCPVSSQEKELFRVGRCAESSRDYGRAIECYKQSTKTTKKPHISLFFIGPCLYRQSKFLEAVRTYTDVIKMSKISSVAHKHNGVFAVPPSASDLYTAYYNRYLHSNFFF